MPAQPPQTNPPVLWRLGDPWRDLLPEIASSSETIQVVSGQGSVRHVNVLNRWQLRVAGPGGAFIRGDGIMTDLASVSVATPCGIITWGHGPDSWSASTVLLLVATDIPDNWTEIKKGLQVADYHATFASHPPHDCGARLCLRER